MEIQRSIYANMLDWKNRSKGSTALLLEGARRVGKSYIAEHFGQNEYKSYILVDFSQTFPERDMLFAQGIRDIDGFFAKLSAIYGTILYHRQSLIIFDEVQLYPPARQMIKHLVADGRYDFIETGSLLSLKQNVANILIPSEEDVINVYPLTFSEFLIARGEDVLSNYIKDSFAEKRLMEEPLHYKAMSLFREYILVGGMPQAVVSYVENKDFFQVDLIKRQILRLYRNDVTRFATGYESKVLAIFDGIPDQLAKHEKKYNLASISKKARFREYEDAFIWLEEGRIINTAFNATDPSVGLSLNLDRLTLKCYMADTGLLISHAFSDKDMTENGIYKAILFNELGLNEGMIMENIVAQELRAAGNKLFFYSRSSVREKEDRMEIDFLIRQEKKICPIEVKSGKRVTHVSLDKFKNKFGKKIGTQYILWPKDLKKEDNIIYLPLYMAMCL